MKKAKENHPGRRYGQLLFALLFVSLMIFSGCGKDTSKAVRKDNAVLSETTEQTLAVIEKETTGSDEMSLSIETETDNSEERYSETAPEIQEIISEESIQEESIPEEVLQEQVPSSPHA